MTGIVLGRDVVGELEPALRREWLVTNGLGGYASGTVAGVATRRYHGLLVAALTPPVDRTVLVGGLVEWLTVDGEPLALHAHEYADGTIDQHGYRRLESFRLDGMLPVWRHVAGEVAIEKRVWMEYGANTTYVRYTVVRGSRPVDVEVVPLVTRRDHHALAGEGAGIPDGEPGLRVLSSGGTEASMGTWFRGFRHREEEARGLDARSDLYAACAYRVTIAPGESWTLTLTSEAVDPSDPEASLAAALVRQATLLERATAGDAPLPIRQLVLAADQFIVDRPIPLPGGTGTEPGRTIVAGYPWFNDWGRDTMIALPGLTLATGRPDQAATILRAFARFVRDGLLPNNFPDGSGEDPGYNTVDASLWYPLAVRAHAEATGSRDLIDELLPTLRSILDHHVAGTRFGIGVDPSDGLLRAGEDGVQLTWMDARVGDRVITPRIGKPVEIQALWINALRTVGGWLAGSTDPADRAAGHAYVDLADRATASFRARFWRADRGHLADVIDGPDGDDWSLRPNQLLALSLPYPLVEGPIARSVLDAVGRELVTSFGLRSLAPSDPAYRSRFQGPPPERDGAYHQGTVWSWLLGPWVDAVVRVTGDRDLARSYLEPIAHHLADAGLGTVSECFEPAPPHEARACIAQAWGVAEILRAWRALDDH